MTNASKENIAPTNELEAKLVEIWSKLLGDPKVGINENFFALGGHSLKATSLVMEVYQELGLELPLRQIFERPTIQELAQYLENITSSDFVRIEKIPERNYYPLSSVQKSQFVLNQLKSDNTSYNMPGALKVEGNLNRIALDKAFETLVKRHEAFRTSFAFVEGEPVQQIHQVVEFKVDYQEASESEMPEIVSEFVKPFDLQKPPLLRVKLVKLAVDEHILLFDTHHIICDGTSRGILINEFIQLYNGKDLSDLRIQYKDFAAWQNEFFQSEEMQKQESYWLETFEDEISVLQMPLDFSRPKSQTFDGNTLEFTIAKKVTDRLDSIAQSQDSTLNMLIFAVYNLLLSKYSDQNEVVVGSLVAGRQHADLTNIIGMFANFLPIKMQLEVESTLKEFLLSARQTILTAYENQEYPFEQLVEKLSIPSDLSRNPLFDTMLIFHNEVDLNQPLEIEGLAFKRYELNRQTSKLDFKLDVYINRQEGLHCNLEYNTNLFEEETMQTFIKHFNFLLEQILSNWDQRISEIELFNQEEEQEIRKRRLHNLVSADDRAVQIAVSATFTAEPIADHLKWWCKKLGIELDLKFASYNQVFQELLDPESLISTNQGANILLIRFEDLIRADKSEDEVLCQKLKRNFAELTRIIEAKEKSVPYFVGIFPIATHLSLSERVIQCLKELNRQWKETLEKSDNVYVVDCTDLAGLYGISEIFDSQKDQVGHVPFSDEYYAALGTMLARKIYAWQKQHFKVIVLDCDNTLWKGICGEDGALGVRVTEPYKALQELMLQKYNEGMLLVLCSKNNEVDAWEVFDKNPQMVLKMEHIAGWRINWQAKSANIYELAQELNLGIDSFIFIDDSSLECIEVMTNAPQVLTLQLPKEPELIPGFLKHVWAFDRFKVTEEDKKRTKMYIAERKRQEAQQNESGLTDFLKNLELKMSMNEMESRQLPRVSQLTQRTNQFNMSTIRRTEEEIKTLLSSPENKCWVIEVTDRFGEYGLVGVVITTEIESTLFVDTFLLSCRVLGRNVEEAILLGLKRYCLEQNLTLIEAKFYPTAKNKPFLNFIEKTGWQKVEETDEYLGYTLIPEEIPENLDYIECYFNSRYSKPAQKAHETVNAQGKSVGLLISLDHIAVAVADIEQAKECYQKIGYECGETIFDPAQNAYLAMCTKTGFDSIELVGPVNHESPCSGIIEKNGEIPYHLCYRVTNVSAFLKQLTEMEIEYDIISEPKPAILFDYKKVSFIYVKDVGLIELLEDSSVSDETDQTLKNTTVRWVISKVEKAIRFFEILGYIQERSYTDPVRKILLVTLKKESTGPIELVIPLDEMATEASFVQKNGPHLYQIYFEMTNLAELSDSKTVDVSYIRFVEKRKKRISECLKNCQQNWEVNIVNEDNLLHRLLLLPLENYSAEQLLKLPIYELAERELSTRYVAPTNPIEEKLVQIWSEILGIDEIGIKDNFFKLGGHSLKATSLISKVYKEFHVELSLYQIFDHPTIHELAKEIAGSKESIYASIEKIEEREYYPVSSAQQRMYVLNQIEGDNHSYNLPGVVRIEGEFDQTRFEKAFKQLIQRHESFRTSFEFVDEQLVQIVHPEIDLQIQYFSAETKSEVTDLVIGFIQPFDLSKAPLLRVGLIKFASEQILIYDMHHIISDGVSTDILFKEFIRLYEGHELAELPIQYKDFAVWQNELFQSEALLKQEEFWLSQFDEKMTGRETLVLNLATDFPRPTRQSFEGDQLDLMIDRELTESLYQLAKETGSTLYMVLIAIYNILLAKYTGQEDIIIGSPIAGRDHVDLENVIGMFVNTLAMRNFPEAGKGFLDFLKEVKERTLADFENQDYQFETLVEKLNLTRHLNRNPLFDTMFRLQNYHTDGKISTELKSIPYKFSKKVSQFDLQLTCHEHSEGLKFTFEYCTKLFKKATIEDLARHFVQLMKNIVADPDKKVGDIEILSAEEKDRLLWLFNQTRVEYLDQKTIHQLFEEQVEKTPNQVALVLGDTNLTYQELNGKANHLARLLRSNGVQPDTIVGIMIERSFEMLVAMVGVMKAGGAYLPIDPEYPKERIQYMLVNSESKILLTQESLKEKVDFAGELICLDNPLVFVGDEKNLQNVNQSSDLIYMIYTSGSTGRPKGTMLEHRSVNNFITGITDRIEVTPGKTILALTTISFDIFVLETLLPLTQGGRVILASESEQKDPQHLIDLIVKNQVEMIQLTPSRLQLFLEDEKSILALKQVNEILVGGEAFPERLLKKLQESTQAKIYNMYGPTETTVWSTMQDLTDAAEVNIGKPIANTQIYILDKKLQLLPKKVIGELYIAGDGLTRGYFKQPELTEERFLPNPFITGELMYRTGDLARWLPDGNIEYMGRIDHQIKIRGYRIETGEIESCLNEHPNIRESVIIAKEAAEGYKYLIGYYVADDEISVSELRVHLLEHLPDYMVPGVYCRLEELPLTPNGKIDRKALPDVGGDRPNLAQEYQAPETEIEKEIADLWKELLKIDQVGVHDNFFDLGGNSILMVQMQGKLEHKFPGKTKIVDLFAYPTVNKLTEYIQSQGDVAERKEDLEQAREYWLTEFKKPWSLLKLPSEYDSDEFMEEWIDLRFELAGDLHQKLKRIAENAEVEVNDILAAMYIYLFSEITDTTDIIIEANVKGNVDHVFPLRVDVMEITDFGDFFKLINQKFKKAMEYSITSVQPKLRERLTPVNIIPIFCPDGGIDLNNRDFALVVEGQEQISLTCTYNIARLKKSKVIEFIQDYLALIEMMVNQYED